MTRPVEHMAATARCVSAQGPPGPSSVSPASSPVRQQLVAPVNAEAPVTARDKLRAGLLQRRAQIMTTLVEPPKSSKRQVGVKKRSSTSFCDVLASSKRPCTGGPAHTAAEPAVSPCNVSVFPEHTLFEFAALEEGAAENKQDDDDDKDTSSEMLSLAVTPYDGESYGESPNTPGSVVDAAGPFWDLDLGVDRPQVDLLVEVDLVKVVDVACLENALEPLNQLVDSWCC